MIEVSQCVPASYINNYLKTPSLTINFKAKLTILNDVKRFNTSPYMHMHERARKTYRGRGALAPHFYSRACRAITLETNDAIAN